MKTRILFALGITAVVLLLAVMGSGAPFRVHVAEAVALLVAFTIPALVVARPRDILNRWKVIIPPAFLGGLAWDFGAAATIAKHELFSLPAIYVAVPLGSIVLLAIHAFAVGIVDRRSGSQGSPSNPPLQADDHLGRSAPSVARR